MPHATCSIIQSRDSSHSKKLYPHRHLRTNTDRTWKIYIVAAIKHRYCSSYPYILTTTYIFAFCMAVAGTSKFEQRKCTYTWKLSLENTYIGIRHSHASASEAARVKVRSRWVEFCLVKIVSAGERRRSGAATDSLTRSHFTENTGGPVLQSDQWRFDDVPNTKQLIRLASVLQLSNLSTTKTSPDQWKIKKQVAYTYLDGQKTTGNFEKHPNRKWKINKISALVIQHSAKITDSQDCSAYRTFLHWHIFVNCVPSASRTMDDGVQCMS